jgi:hypothetical protein
MARRNGDFSPKTRALLANRAGHECSICQCLTSAPAGLEGAISNGEAAHIVAAQSGGPRSENSLDDEAKRSMGNGIWLCKLHASEIDRDVHKYSVQTLRALKRNHEYRIAFRYQSPQKDSDSSGILLTLPHIQSPIELFDIVSKQGYDFQTLSAMCNMLSMKFYSVNFYEILTDLIADMNGRYPREAGILATILCDRLSMWEPSSNDINKLSRICADALKNNQWINLEWTEPLALALSAKGSSKPNEILLEELVYSNEWRSADQKRIASYYGKAGTSYAEFFTHWNDPYRKGLSRLNDVGRLIHAIQHEKRMPVRIKLRNLLLEQAVFLKSLGKGRMAVDINSVVLAADLTIDLHSER